MPVSDISPTGIHHPRSMDNRSEVLEPIWSGTSTAVDFKKGSLNLAPNRVIWTKLNFRRYVGRKALFDHAVCLREQRGRQCKTKRLRRFQIDGE